MSQGPHTPFGQPPERATLIAAEKVRIQYRNMPTAFIGSAMICSLMGFALVKGAGVAKVAGWMSTVYLWSLMRMLQWRAFNKIAPPPTDMDRWRRLGIAGSALSGLIWGVGALVLYVPDGLPYQFFLLTGLVGMGAGSVYASASVMPSFFTYFYPSILLPAVLFLHAPGRIHFVTGLLLIL